MVRENRTEQNITEQNRTEQNRTEQNRLDSCQVVFAYVRGLDLFPVF